MRNSMWIIERRFKTITAGSALDGASNWHRCSGAIFDADDALRELNAWIQGSTVAEYRMTEYVRKED